jgi:hypothetical protein
MFLVEAQREKRTAGLAFSAASHAVLFALLAFLVFHHQKVRPIYRESRCCSYALYWSGSKGAGNAKPVATVHRKRRSPSSAPASSASSNPAPVPSAQSAQAQPGIAAPQQQPTFGTGAGTENAEPAFPVYYPTPAAPDPGLLPASEQKIIVDVEISAMGEVTDERLVQGLGNGLDRIVLDTVKGWRFHPATLNGTAIASVEELVFPYSRNAPSNDPSTPL